MGFFVRVVSQMFNIEILPIPHQFLFFLSYCYNHVCLQLKAERQQARAARPVAAPRAVGVRKSPAVEGSRSMGVTGSTVSSAGRPTKTTTKAQRPAGRGEKKK